MRSLSADFRKVPETFLSAVMSTGVAACACALSGASAPATPGRFVGNRRTDLMKTAKIFLVVVIVSGAASYARAVEGAGTPAAPGQSVTVSTAVDMAELDAMPLNALATKIKAAKDSNERRQYVGAVRRFKPKNEKDIRLLVDLATEDSRKGVAMDAALYSISNVKATDTQLEPAFINMLQDKRARARNIAMQMCGMFKSKKALPIILEKFRKMNPDAADEDSQTEHVGMWASLGAYGKDAIPGLLKIAKENPNKRLHKQIGYAIGEIKDKDSIPQLIEMVKDKTVAPEIRTKAIDVAGKIGGEDAIQELMKIFKEEKDYKSKVDLVIAIGHGKSTTAIPFLEAVLRNELDSTLRSSATTALERIGGTKATDVLTEALKTEIDNSVRERIAYSLKKLTGKDYDWKNTNPQ